MIDADVLARFWAKVDKTDGCWLWTANTNGVGYGKFRLRNPRRLVGAHRFAYEALVGPIPHGLHLDHLCRNPPCVNPAHLEPVTVAENLRRGDSGKAGAAFQRAKTHCPHGHAYDEANTGWYKGTRYCRACKREASRRDRANAKRSRRYKAQLKSSAQEAFASEESRTATS